MAPFAPHQQTTPSSYHYTAARVGALGSARWATNGVVQEKSKKKKKKKLVGNFIKNMVSFVDITCCKPIKKIKLN
ncbi:hypothetical protein HanRHA438_Chr04g0154151 [Helianthus annuus]|nr:hypothetical protein HanRHA438_Chr04g0154151 [Helianthus annuus]